MDRSTFKTVRGIAAGFVTAFVMMLALSLLTGSSRSEAVFEAVFVSVGLTCMWSFMAWRRRT